MGDTPAGREEKDTIPPSPLAAAAWEEAVKSPMVVWAVEAEVGHVPFTKLPPTLLPCTSPDTVEITLFPA